MIDFNEYEERKRNEEILDQLRIVNEQIRWAKKEGKTQILIQPLYQKNIMELEKNNYIINRLFLQDNESYGIEVANLIQWGTKCEEEKDTLERNSLPKKIVLDKDGFNAFWTLHEGGFM